GDGQRLICGSDDRTIKGWELNDRPQGPFRLGRVVAETGLLAHIPPGAGSRPLAEERSGLRHRPRPRAKPLTAAAGAGQSRAAAWRPGPQAAASGWEVKSYAVPRENASAKACGGRSWPDGRPVRRKVEGRHAGEPIKLRMGPIRLRTGPIALRRPNSFAQPGSPNPCSSRRRSV